MRPCPCRAVIAFVILLMQCMQRMQSSGFTESSPFLSSQASAPPGHLSAMSPLMSMPLCRVFLHLFLVDADAVPPGADDGEVGAGDRGHAVVGAAGRLDLELVGPPGPVELVLEGLGQVVDQVERVEAGPLASRRPDAARRRPQARSRSRPGRSRLDQLVEARLDVLGAWSPGG